MAEAVPSGSERELHGGGGSIFDQDHQLFWGEDVTGRHTVQGIAHLLQSLKEGDCADYLLFIRFLRAAQRAFIKADSFLRAAGLICGRLPAFFVAGFRVAAGLDPRFRSAHRAFMAAAIRRRAAALIVRFRGPFVSPLFGGRPRRRIGPETSPSRAEIAWFNRERSDFS